MLFIVHGKPGGQIEKFELPTYPVGHHYMVQKNAWMDARVWQTYLTRVLLPELDPDTLSVVMADNLKCHVSDEAMATLCTDLCCDFAPIPENSTGTWQPLDAGVMGPLKAMLRTAWLKERPVYTAAARRLAMIKRVIKVWDVFSSETVQKSFVKAIPRPQ